MTPVRGLGSQAAAYGAAAASSEAIDKAKVEERVEAVKKRSIYVRCSVDGCLKKMLRDALRKCECSRIVCSKHQFAHGCLFVYERKPDDSDRPEKRQNVEGGGGRASSDFAY